jgi:hypothetical protein
MIGLTASLCGPAAAPGGTEDAHALASLSLGSLISTRLLTKALAITSTLEDELLVRTWVELLTPALHPRAPDP